MTTEIKEDIWKRTEAAARHVMERIDAQESWNLDSYVAGYKDGLAYATKQLDILIAEQKKGEK